MIKGCEKKIIFLESTKSKYFEQAYLVMKDDLYTLNEGDILEEAERIIFGAEHLKRMPKKKSRLPIWKTILLFLGGIFVGIGIAFFVSFFIK